MAVADYLNQLQKDKQTLIDYLVENGVETTSDETFTTLITKLKNANFGKFTPSHISFYGYSGSDLSEEIANIDFSKITSLKYLFRECTNLKNIDLSQCNFGEITNMSSMFYQCNLVNTINLGNINTSKVTNMASLFYQCYDLKSLDLSGFDTSNVTTMASMFNYCEDLESLDLSNFDTSKVTNMSSMFWMCVNLKYLDIRNFDFTNVTSYSSMFTTVSTSCEIIVKDDTAKNWIIEKFTTLTNIKTVAELEAV